MISSARCFAKRIIYLILFTNACSVLFAQTPTENSNRTTDRIETISFAPIAVSVLSPEEEENTNQEGVRVSDTEVEELKFGQESIKLWRQKSFLLFLKKLFVSFLGAILFSVSLCFFISRINNRELTLKGLFRIIISVLSTLLILLLLYSAIPYFYNFWSIGNLLLGCIIWQLIIRNYGVIFVFSKKDVIIIPILLLGTWGCMHCLTPRMRDIPNTIVLDAQTDKELIYMGTVSQRTNIRAKADFLAHYNYINLDENWTQTGSYRATLNKGSGRITLYLPTELIQNYALGIELNSKDKQAQGTLSINGQSEIPWQTTDSQNTIALYDTKSKLYPEEINRPAFFIFLCIVGSALSVFLILRIAERLVLLFFNDKQKAFELAFLVICVLFCVTNLKNTFFMDNCPDLNAMASNVSKHFTTKHPPMIYVWWLMARFISPFESINASFVFGTLVSFWGGIWLLGSLLIKNKFSLFAFSIMFACLNFVSSSMYNTRLYVDQIVVSTCLLSFGLCTRIGLNKGFKKVLLSVFIAVLIMVVVSVRLEGLSYTVPISIVFVSLLLFEKKKGFKRVFLSGLIGSILVIALLSSYKFVISPYVFHATKAKGATIDNLFREALGICYFSQDWDDLPDFFTDDAKNALDRTKFIKLPRPYRNKYLPKVKSEQIQDFWLHMIKKHPLAYLRTKWVGNQVLWKIRPLYSNPRNTNKDVVPEKTGLSFADFFRDEITSFCLVLPSWVPQLSLLFVFLFVGILLFKFNDSLLWIIWGIGASGFLHNFAFFLISAAPNYRYIFWADISGCISFFLACLVVGKFIEWLRLKHNHNNQSDSEDNNETVCTDTLFQ